MVKIVLNTLSRAVSLPQQLNILIPKIQLLFPLENLLFN